MDDFITLLDNRFEKNSLNKKIKEKIKEQIKEQKYEELINIINSNKYNVSDNPNYKRIIEYFLYKILQKKELHNIEDTFIKTVLENINSQNVIDNNILFNFKDQLRFNQQFNNEKRNQYVKEINEKLNNLDININKNLLFYDGNSTLGYTINNDYDSLLNMNNQLFSISNTLNMTFEDLLSYGGNSNIGYTIDNDYDSLLDMNNQLFSISNTLNMTFEDLLSYGENSNIGYTIQNDYDSLLNMNNELFSNLVGINSTNYRNY
jgi:hypothetical protein